MILAAPPTTIWITYRGIVIKAAPEQLRHASLDEKFTLSGWIDDIAQTRQELEQEPRQGYIDLSIEERPGENESPDYELIEEEETRPRYRLSGKTAASQVTTRSGSPGPTTEEDLQAVDVWESWPWRREGFYGGFTPSRARLCFIRKIRETAPSLLRTCSTPGGLSPRALRPV